ncbi:hypothetical protein KR032_000337, partial [Drosophila birchii]
MASLGGQHENISNNPEVENTSKRPESREGSAERKAHAFAPAKSAVKSTATTGCGAGATLHWFAQVGGGGTSSEEDTQASKDREEKLKYARDRQNEERQRKIEELRAQAEAAQRYREQKEEERRRRIEEIRIRDTEKRHQVEERKKAIFEAEKERREYILKKNQERDSRIEVKKRDRNSIGFAFGSSTPRLLDVPADYGLVSPSAFWGQRRSTSISNVAGASLSRRSSERELADSGAKKRASSSTDRHDDHRRKSSSMYEVFNWGYSNDEPPKRFSLSIAGSEINIDGPANPPSSSSNKAAIAHRPNPTATATNITPIATSTTGAGHNNNHNYNHNSYRKEDSVDTSPMVFRSVYRRKTDLMPTIPSPRDGHYYGSRSSLSTTPARTPGRAYSMNRLDQLAQPIRRNGEHVRAILERERRERELEMLDETSSLGGGVGGRRGPAGSARSRRAGSAGSGSSSAAGIMSRSMTHLAGGRDRGKYSLGGGISTSFRPLASGAGGQRDTTSKSMTQISSWSVYGSTAPQQPNYQHNLHQRQSTLGLQTAATKKYLQSSFASTSSFNASFRANANATGRGRGQQQQYAISTNPHRFLDFDPNSLLLMNSASLLVNAGSRSGNATPGGHYHSSSRPGSAMSTSTNVSTSGLVPRRPATAPRKPRPASIAGTGMSLDEINKLKKDQQKPPVKTTAASPSAQTTPKRTANLMSTSMIVTSSSTRLSSAEKKMTTPKREPLVPKAASASKALSSRTASSERISRLSKEPKTKDTSAMSRSMIVTSSSSSSTVTTTTKAAPAAPVAQAAPAVAPAPVPAPVSAVEQNGVAKEAEKTPAEVPASASAEVPPAVAPSVSKAEKEALNSSEKTEEVARQEEQVAPQAVEPVPEALVTSVNVEEKADEGTEKEAQKPPQEQAVPKKPRSKENSEVRELTPPEGGDLMTASMMAKKITTEEEAKAALAERRRLAREEAERQAELERQRLEAERLAELKAQEEEAERQRLFEEESTRLAEEQRRAEEERLRKAIEEAQQREKEEQRKLEEEEKQRVEREEAEKKAKEEAEKQRVEVAERLKREEKEREERRKRVEAIMSRTRKAGGAASTPAKDSNDKAANATAAAPADSSSSNSDSGSSNNSAGGSPSSTTDAKPAPAVAQEAVTEPPNSQAMYEQSVLDKENSLINSFSTMIIDENAKNLQQVSNGKLLVDFEGSNPTPTVANGNGHIESVNNKNDINLLQDVVAPVASQLIDLSIESQQDLHLNNNNSLLTSTAATTTLVTADSHENKGNYIY